LTNATSRTEKFTPFPDRRFHWWYSTLSITVRDGLCITNTYFLSCFQRIHLAFCTWDTCF
jgi:hypothetical protein